MSTQHAPDEGAPAGRPAPYRFDPVPGVPDALVPLWHVLLRCFGRTPTEKEMEIWAKVAQEAPRPMQFLRRLAGSAPFTRQRHVRANNPPGHYFSPVVDPETVRAYVDAENATPPDGMAGIDFDLEAMARLWQANAAHMAAVSWTEAVVPPNRYAYIDVIFPPGDALTARMMVHHFRPRRVIEIGSGYSSAALLDAADHAGLTDFHMTCIEPYPTRLKTVVPAADFATRVTLRECRVQEVELDLFRALEPGDILFIDSSHVMKTGSDVHYELFHILPSLKPGVVIHFHDCRFPLEYSDIQIFQKNYSWNEAYALRALLMYSTRFKVLFSGSLFARCRRDAVQSVNPDYLRHAGSSLWIIVADG